MSAYEYADRHADVLDQLEAGAVLQYPDDVGGRRLTLVDVDRRTYPSGKRKVEVVAEKESGATVDLREHHLESAIDAGAELVLGGDAR